MNNSQIIANRIREICKERKIPISKLNSDCKLSKNFISEMDKKGYSPSIEKLITIAQYLNISIDYLVGREATQRTIIDNSIGKEGGDIITGGTQVNTTPKDNDTYIVKAITQEVRKMSKAEQIDLLSKINKE